MGRRTNLAITIVASGIILLIAIAVGNEMGNRVLGQATERGPAILATPVATPVGFDPDPGDVNWRRNHVVSVATDPAFPDPRVTPPPPPTAPPPPPRRPRPPLRTTSRPPRRRRRAPVPARRGRPTPRRPCRSRSSATSPTKARLSRPRRSQPRPHSPRGLRAVLSLLLFCRGLMIET